jgi:hypothetical protein
VVPQGSAGPGDSVDAFVAGSLNPSAAPSTLAGAAAFVSFRASPLVVKTVAVVVGFPKSWFCFPREEAWWPFVKFWWPLPPRPPPCPPRPRPPLKPPRPPRGLKPPRAGDAVGVRLSVAVVGAFLSLLCFTSPHCSACPERSR